MSDQGSKQPAIHDVPPRESVGRDTIARYQAQFRGAAFECLALLEDDKLDRVYCDYQDDFVSRMNLDGNFIYNFYQVKTKKKSNAQWSVNDIFGMRKKAKSADPKKIGASFAGKLLIHTIRFSTSCGQVAFLTNIHIDDDVEQLVEAISSKGDNEHYELLLKNFNDALCADSPLEDDEVAKRVQKLQLRSNLPYLNPHDDTFFALARDKIYKYSEIDLQHTECEEILLNLVALVERKSFGFLLETLSESDLDDGAGIGVTEMLEILSISKDAYRRLKDSGDVQAIKNASIIQRWLESAGASEAMIEYISGCKVDWDIWFRENRHFIAEFDLNFLLNEIESLATGWTSSQEAWQKLRLGINELYERLSDEGLAKTLDRNLLLGAVFSFVVRGAA